MNQPSDKTSGTNILEIRDLHVQTGDKMILKGLNLEIRPGEVHAIMGPNGSGKSTLAQVLAGHDQYQVVSGEIRYQDKDLLPMTPDERAREGLFMAFQYPVEIPGVSSFNLMKDALNSLRRHRGQTELDALDFLTLVKEKLDVLGIDDTFLKRAVNVGFSGGEKKRNEILQLLILEPQLLILDEIDSGLDIDALQVVAAGINRLRHPERAFILITHYPRLLEHIRPDYIHVLGHGRILRTGHQELAQLLEQHGYAWVEQQTHLDSHTLNPAA